MSHKTMARLVESWSQAQQGQGARALLAEQEARLLSTDLFDPRLQTRWCGGN